MFNLFIFFYDLFGSLSPPQHTLFLCHLYREIYIFSSTLYSALPKKHHTHTRRWINSVLSVAFICLCVSIRVYCIKKEYVICTSYSSFWECEICFMHIIIFLLFIYLFVVVGVFRIIAYVYYSVLIFFGFAFYFCSASFSLSLSLDRF